MAIEYYLYFEDTLDRDQNLQRLANTLRLAYNPDRTFVQNLAVQIGINSLQGRNRTQQMLTEELGFLPITSVWFRLLKIRDADTGQLAIDDLLFKRTTLKATSLLLAQNVGDAALMYNGELIDLIRREGQIKVNNAYHEWTPEELAEITLPYTIENTRY